MAHQICVSMVMSDAQKLQKMGREIAGDESLGINQACHVLLESLASDKYELRKRQARARARAPEESD